MRLKPGQNIWEMQKPVYYLYTFLTSGSQLISDGRKRWYSHVWHLHTCVVELHSPKGAVTPAFYPAKITGQNANENDRRWLSQELINESENFLQVLVPYLAAIYFVNWIWFHH